MNSIKRLFCKISFTTKTRLALYENIASFLEQGRPLGDVLIELAESYQKQSEIDARVEILQEWSLAFRGGKRFSDAISPWVPASECMLVRAGEQSGDPVKGIRAAILATTGVSQMIEAIRKNLSYPGFLFLALVGFIYYFSANVVPQLAQTMDPEKWTGSAHTLHTVSVIVNHYWWLIALLLMAIAGLIGYSMPRWIGGARQRFDSLPPWSIYQTIQGSVFLISLASMMQSGTPIVSAIKSLRTLSSAYVSSHLARMGLRLDSGRSIGDALNTGLFKGELRTQVEIYGKLSDFETKLAVLGERAIKDGIVRIESISSVLSQCILLALGVYIAWVYVTFMNLIDSITSSSSMM